MTISSIFVIVIVTGITKLHKHHKMNNSRSRVDLLLVDISPYCFEIHRQICDDKMYIKRGRNPRVGRSIQSS